MNEKDIIQDYYAYLKQVHNIIAPKTYLEIGIRKGESFFLASPQTLSIGIDPKPQIYKTYPENFKIYSVASDEFFQTYNLKKELNNRDLDLAFIDGMHLFEYALNDFINIEKNATPSTIVLIHDCLPLDSVTSQRERETEVWTGDVWKIIFCLLKYRPQLKISLIDAKPSGLALLSNLDPQNTFLEEHKEEIKNEFIPVTFDFYEKNSSQIQPLKKDLQTALNLHASGKNQIQEMPQQQKTTLTADKEPQKKALPKKSLSAPKLLVVLLCYNDADILDDVINYYLENNHDIIAWDHGSDDETPHVLDTYNRILVERKFLPREFDFYNMHPEMSKNLITNYISRYDWITWPDQDEILEGPRRDKSYYHYLLDVINSPYNWIRFNNFNFWVTKEDDPAVISPVKRVRHYCLFPDCAPRIRAWRASETNIRKFNHNTVQGEGYPERFNLKHYGARTYEQLDRRIFKDRANLQRSDMNYHYNTMKNQINKTRIDANLLHFDDGVSELNKKVIFDWKELYNPPHLRSAKVFDAPKNINEFLMTIRSFIEKNDLKNALQFYNLFRNNFPAGQELVKFDNMINQMYAKQKNRNKS